MPKPKNKKIKQLTKRVITGEFPSQILSKHIRVSEEDHKLLGLMKLHGNFDSIGTLVHYLLKNLHWNTDYTKYSSTNISECLAQELLEIITECKNND